MITSEIVSRKGKQYLRVNGEDSEVLAYVTYLPQKGRYADFAEAGYKLFSTCVFFGSNKLNEYSGLQFFSKGIFDEDIPDFSGFDANIADILAACPDALIFPRVNVSLSEKWDAEHPEELCFEGCSRYPERKRPCFASDIWAQEIKRQLTLFCEHVEKSSYCEHIVGYQIAGGNTEEWFAYNDKGGDGKRAREKFARSGREETEEAYYQFLSQITAERICEFAAHIKALTDRRLVVGTFYGYTLEKCGRGGAHHALSRVLRCPDIDFICSPVSYSQQRRVGRDHPYMLPLHSLKLHNKLYFSENDTRTHLSAPLCDNPHYNSPIWFGPDEDTTLEILKMHFARALVNGHACWWFDMWGGWYAQSKYMAFMKKARQIEQVAALYPANSCTEVAVVLDERAPAALDDRDKGLQNVFYHTREALGKAGAPYGIYLSSDFDHIKDEYKAFILLEPRPTADSERIKASGKPLLVITPENSDITTSTLRSFYEENGVWLFSREDMVVYASEQFLFLHTVKPGQHQLLLPDAEKLTEVFENRPFSKSFTAPAGKSYLLKRQK